MAVAVSTGKYKVYHIPGQKVGCTTNLEERVTKQQGFKPGEYEILFESDDIRLASDAERTLQEDLGYKVDIKPYHKLFKEPMKKNINVTDQTTTFPISIKDINANFLESLSWSTQYGDVVMDSTDKIDWVLSNVQESMFNKSRSYVYNKALYEAGPFQKHANTNVVKNDITISNIFNLIRSWAEVRGIFDKGNSHTQYVKLMEEAGELAQGLLKKDRPEIKDAIGDMVVVLTNLAHLEGFAIEDCIETAYVEIINRKGKMLNGTFVKEIEVKDPETISAFPDPGPPPELAPNVAWARYKSNRT